MTTIPQKNGLGYFPTAVIEDFRTRFDSPQKVLPQDIERSFNSIKSRLKNPEGLTIMEIDNLMIDLERLIHMHTGSFEKDSLGRELLDCKARLHSLKIGKKSVNAETILAQRNTYSLPKLLKQKGSEISKNLKHIKH